MKKIFVLCIGIIALFFCLMRNTSDETVLKFSTWGSASEVAILKPIIKDFENSHNGVKVEVLHIPQDYFQKLHLLFASNMEPDVLLINNQNIPAYAKFLCELDEVIDKQNYFNKSIECMTYDNRIYAVPRDCSGLVIYYNKDIFDKYGVAYPKKNWSLEDLLYISRYLSKISNNNIWGISFEPSFYYALPFVNAFGGGVYNKKSYVGESIKTVEGINFYKNLAYKYHCAPVPSEVGSKTLAQMFLEGKIAMHLSGRWLTPKYRDSANFRWDIINFPDFKSTNDATGWAISKRSKNKELAKEFVLYLSSKRSIDKLCGEGLIVPARKDIANSKTFLNGIPKSSNIFIESVEKSSVTNVDKNFNRKIDMLNEKYFNEAK